MSVYCQNCDHLRAENKQLQAELHTTAKQIGWLKGDKARLSKSIQVRDNAITALIEVHEAELATAKAENEHLCDNMTDMRAGTPEGKLRAENKRLKEFARPVIRQECWSIFEPDGLKIHDLAEKLGLIVPCTATEEDVDETIFIFSETLKESD